METETGVRHNDGPQTVGQSTGRCIHCKCSILTVQFVGREAEWFHVNTRFRICQGGLTEAQPFT